MIPKGFSLAVLKEEPTKLLLITNPSQRVLPGIAEELLKILTEVAFYAHRLLGPEIKAMVQGPPTGQSMFPDADVARLSASINQSMRKVGKYVFPPVIELEMTVVKPPLDSSAPSVPFMFYCLPGTLIVGLLFASQGLSGDVWQEREAGLLRRIAASPLGTTRFLLGKLLADAAILAGLSLFLLAGGMAYFQNPLVAVASSAGMGGRRGPDADRPDADDPGVRIHAPRGLVPDFRAGAAVDDDRREHVSP